ncbi:hypothetical protein [Prosthecomicrobium pneumaticum]|uniref:Uncharacterized protein n=1 Tax=Prosthecomicrobium pneumaticum TaxID=81895 RepID=A0A7W9FR10_9HYPH|nr:hypothetical protein [Prosthecomicrobium pneumaticum]MBB5755208.1 hypothetical protein [Prosthecomicrobium pneumaticum]
MRLDTNVTAKERPIYTVLDDPGLAAGNEIIVTIFDWQGRAPVRATLGWMAHARKEAEVGPDESDEVEVGLALARARQLQQRYGFQRIVIVLEHEDLWDPAWGELVRR